MDKDMKQMSLVADYTVSEDLSIEDFDTRFLKVSIDVMHTGLNMNNTYFEKAVVEKAIPSIKNTPILGYIEYDGDDPVDFTGHAYIKVKDGDGEEKRYAGSAYGVIPEDCDPRWVEKECDDGETREFLRVDGLMWTKFDDAVDIIVSDGEKSQSMEIDFLTEEGEEDENGVYHFGAFLFNGCCILGDKTEPAMINSVIVPDEEDFSVNVFMSEIQKKLNEYSLIIERTKNDSDTDKAGENDMDFEQTQHELFKEIREIVAEHEKYVEWNYEFPRYNAEDILGNEVIVCDVVDGFKYYGVPFTVEGDKPVLDFENMRRKKLTYTDYEDGEVPDDNDYSVFEDIRNSANEKIESLKAENEGLVQERDTFATEIGELKTENESLTTERDGLKAEIDSLKTENEQFKADEQARIESADNARKDELIAEFGRELSDDEEFTAIVENKGDMTSEEIETKCSILYAKKNLKQGGFSKTKDNGALNIQSDGDFIDGNVYVSSRYGEIKKK